MSSEKKLETNRLAPKVYFHPDSFCFLTKLDNSSLLLKNNKSNQNIISSLSILKQRISNSIRTEITNPLKTNIYPEFSCEKIKKAEKSDKNINKSINDTMQTLINILTKKPKSLKKKDQKSQSILISLRLKELNKLNPNPHTIKLSKHENYKILLPQIEKKNKKRPLSPIKKQSDFKKEFFLKLNLDLFIYELIENLNYLQYLKGNAKISARIIKGFLSYNEDIGNILLNKKGNELKLDFDIDLLKSAIKDLNDNDFENDFIKKIYFFNETLKDYIENFNFDSSRFETEKFNDDYLSYKLKELNYLQKLKQKDFPNYKYYKNVLIDGENQIKFSKGNNYLVNDIYRLENNLGYLPLISSKERLISKYVDHLTDGHKYVINKNNFN